MTYTKLKKYYWFSSCNNAITDKSSKISQYIELMEDSSNKYEIYFLTVMDSDGDTHWVLIVELFLSEN